MMWKCENTMPLFYASLAILILASIYPHYMMVRMFRKDKKKHLMPNIERNCKLAYMREMKALAVVYDTFSFANYQIVKKKTYTVPKLVASLKCAVEDMPQFILQVIYLLAYDHNTSDDVNTIIYYIAVGLISFLISIVTALTSRSSLVDTETVMSSIDERIKDFHDHESFEKECSLEDDFDEQESRSEDTS